MESLLLNEKLERPVRVTEFPAISLLLPFEPKMSTPTELEQKLKGILSTVKERLKTIYSHIEMNEVMLKLNDIVKHLDYSTYKKSLAIFISPSTQKCYYLDIPVHDKIVIDEPFELRDLVRSKKEFQKYLVLVLSGEWTRIYLGNSNQFMRIVSNVPDRIDAFRNDIPERVGNFSDPSHRKEVMLKKFLRYTDHGLNILLQAYPLPLFVMGPEKLLGYFRHMTKNSHNIVGYVKGNFINVSEVSIRAEMLPHITNWELVKQQYLLNQIEITAGAAKLAIGMRQVLRDARQKKGRLLIVERNFFPSKRIGSSHILAAVKGNQELFFISDDVDEAIEHVLESGGDVEFVEDGALHQYEKIALINYY